jgi:hypothetical protein
MHRLLSGQSLVALVAEAANEVLQEEGLQQRFNASGKPLRRTPTVDPDYHAYLTANSRKESDERARRMTGGRLPVV